MGYTDHDLVVIVPMLGRPHRVAPLLTSLIETVPNARTLFMLSDGDTEVIRAVTAIGGQLIRVPYRPVGDYARKINLGVRASDQPLIFSAADDLKFHAGWFEAAIVQLKPGIGVVGTNDLGSPRVMNGEHSTHFLFTREYANMGTLDNPGTPMCELYPHEFVDDEFVGTARKRNAWAMALDSHVEHLHPNWGKAPMDASYASQASRMRRGRGLYTQRRRMWV